MSQITAKILAHSRSSITGKEIITWELVYPRFIHSEFMTHRLFSRNAASSRAIPVEKIIEQVRLSPAMPVHWGKNQPGMQASEELTGELLAAVQRMWIESSRDAARNAEIMAKYGAHKQIANRVLEPFQWMKTVMTATEDDNWFWLRDHTDADPTINKLASVMWEAKLTSEPFDLRPGDWHTPYYGDGYWLKGCGVPLADALAVSSSCCAQVSFRMLDDTLEKALRIFQKLIESKPVHASPFEHQASPMKRNADFRNKGITHKDRAGNFWSGNFMGFIQHRQLIPNNACWDYKG